MGKYQLDYKGQASVQKFHEKNSNKKTDKLSKIEELKNLYGLPESAYRFLI